MVKRGWDAHVLGKAPNQFTDALTAVKTLRVGQPPSLPQLTCMHSRLTSSLLQRRDLRTSLYLTNTFRLL